MFKDLINLPKFAILLLLFLITMLGAVGPFMFFFVIWFVMFGYYIALIGCEGFGHLPILILGAVINVGAFYCANENASHWDKEAFLASWLLSNVGSILLVLGFKDLFKK